MKNHIEIKKSKIITIPIIAIGILILFSTLNNPAPPGVYVISILLIFYGFYLQSKRISVVNMDAKYQSWLSRKSIKNIESFTTSGIWILNSVSVTGRGKAKIKMSFVSDFYKTRKLAEKIEDLKD
jgi:xanthosine utilization system XapX-like protein